jgi:hypothetical protein
MRKQLHRKVREVRKQLTKLIKEAPADEAEQVSVLEDYATAVLTALNRDGTAPFDFAAVRTAEDLDEIEASLQRLGKKGAQ